MCVSHREREREYGKKEVNKRKDLQETGSEAEC